MPRPRTNKFNVAPAEHRRYKDRTYDSRAEMQYAARLDADPDVLWWIRQPMFDLTVDDTYRPDFLVCVQNPRMPNHMHIYAVDVKGVATAQFNRAKKLWAKYAPIDLHVVKRGATVEIVEGTQQ